MTSFASGLTRCIAACEKMLASFPESERSSRSATSLLQAVSALQAALHVRHEDGEMSALTWTIAARLAREAAAAIRSHGLGERLLRCAEACERAAFLCEDVLPQAA